MSTAIPRKPRRRLAGDMPASADTKAPPKLAPSMAGSETRTTPNNLASFRCEQDITVPDNLPPAPTAPESDKSPPGNLYQIPGLPTNWLSDDGLTMSHSSRLNLFAHILHFPRLAEEAVRRLEEHAALGYSLNTILLCAQKIRKTGTLCAHADFRPLVESTIQDVIDTNFSGVFDGSSQDLLDSATREIGQVFALLENTDDLNEKLGFELLKQHLSQTALPKLELQLRIRRKYPGAILELLADAYRELGAICAMGYSEVRSMADDWAEHEERLKANRGRDIIGLRTGMKELDRRTLGLRGLFLLAAPPAAGKTVLACAEIGLGVCEHHAENDCAVVILSLDMFKDDLYSRTICNVANLDWKTLICGPLGEQAQLRLEQAKGKLGISDVGRHLFVFDRLALGDDISVSRLAMIIEECKRKSNAKRALLIIDYLQLLPVPDEIADRGDLHADKYRVRLVQQVLEGSKTAENPQGDTVLAISEARKPANSKEAWGQSLSELMGTARLGYAGDGVLFFKPMPWQEIKKHYGLPPEPSDTESQKDTQKYREKMLKAGYNPMMLRLEKGRDGMETGEWPVEFDFRRSKIRELPEGVVGSNWSGFRGPPASQLIPMLAGAAVSCHEEVESVLPQYPDPEILDTPPGKKGAKKKTAKKASEDK